MKELDNVPLKGQINIFDFLADFERAEEVDVRGLMDDGYCPKCNACQEDLIKICPYCGQRLSWERWKEVNDYHNKGES